MNQVAVILSFAFMGFLGGVAYVFLWRIKKPYEIGRHVILGTIIGFLYFFLHTEYHFPDLVMAFVSGFASEAFLHRVSEWSESRKQTSRPTS